MNRRLSLSDALVRADVTAITPRLALAVGAASPFGALASGPGPGETERFQVGIDAPRRLSCGTCRNGWGTVPRFAAARQSGGDDTPRL